MLEVGTLITGVITGPIIGLFMVGMLLPMVTNGGAVTSFIGSILLTRWALQLVFVQNDQVSASLLLGAIVLIGMKYEL